MKNKFLSVLLTVAMVLAMIVVPTTVKGNTASAASDGSITVLYTNDVHTYIDQKISYAELAGLKQALQKDGQYVALVDAGDHIQGTAFGGMDNGKTIVKLMNAAGYDVATLGNHEFDYGMEGALDTIKNATYTYVSCNFYHESKGVAGDPVLAPYKVMTFGDKKVAFVGVTTPESFTKSTPAYFQDGKGNYIYGIAGGKDGKDLYAAVQKAVDAASKEADYVIALAHLGDDASSSPWTSEEVIANTTGIDALIDGHSHSKVVSKEVKDKAGNTVILSQTGNYFATVGKMTISKDGKITTELLGADEIAAVSTPDAAVKEMRDAWVNEIETKLGAVIAETDINFTIVNAEGKRLVRKQETNLGDLNADAYYYYINQVAGLDCDVTIMNGGGVRASVAAGQWTYKTCKTVNTFGNVLCLMEVPGQMILDALEFGAKDRDAEGTKENGGFLQVAGVIYNIDYTIPSTITKDEKNVWQKGPSGEYRVNNVRVYNKETGKYEALDVKKMYKIGGTNYTLRQQGDGFNMFQESAGMKLIMEGICVDYLATAAYLQAFDDTDKNGIANISTKSSPLTKLYSGMRINYENMTGAARIGIGESYKVEKGDTLWSIAKETYGKGKLYTRIAAANEGKIKNPKYIHTGSKIFLPIVE